MYEEAFSIELFNDMLFKLKKFHSVFYNFWTMGYPYFTDKIPTACVSFDKDGEFFKFYFNKDFWNSLNDFEKCFVISHEAMHIFLRHGKVSRKDYPNSNKLNIAMDLVINHFLEDYYGMNRNFFRNWDNYCWIDTCQFSVDKDSVKKHKSTKYYYDILKDSDNETEQPQLVDSHSSLDDNDETKNDSVNNTDEISDEIPDETLNEIIDESGFDESLNPDNNNKLESHGSGTNIDNEETKTYQSTKKVKWSSILKKAKERHVRYVQKAKSSFVFEDRRYSGIFDQSFMLPGYTYNTEKEYDKPYITLFMDVSASCYGYVDMFVQMIKTIPVNNFDVEIFVFDTCVKKLNFEYVYYNKNVKIPIGGGTDFFAIEEELRRMKSYPDNVYVMTDGKAEKPKSIYPERWNFLLIGKSGHYGVMENSKKYYLENLVVE